MSMGVQAIFGPSDYLLGAHVHSICDALDIPHLESRLDLDTVFDHQIHHPANPDGGSSPTVGSGEFSINLHPAQNLINAALQDVMSYLNWTRVAIVFEKDYGKPNYWLPSLLKYVPMEFGRSQRHQNLRNCVGH